MKQFLVIALVAAAAIVMAVGMNRREKAEQSEEKQETAAEARPSAAQNNNAAYRDLDLVRGSSSKAIRKDYTGFRLAFNPDNRTPEWVAW